MLNSCTLTCLHSHAIPPNQRCDDILFNRPQLNAFPQCCRNTTCLVLLPNKWARLKATLAFLGLFQSDLASVSVYRQSSHPLILTAYSLWRMLCLCLTPATASPTYSRAVTLCKPVCVCVCVCVYEQQAQCR